MIRIAGSYRSNASISDANFENSLVVDVVSELGFSVVPLLNIMEICPSTVSIQYGYEYLLSL